MDATRTLASPMRTYSRGHALVPLPLARSLSATARYAMRSGSHRHVPPTLHHAPSRSVTLRHACVARCPPTGGPQINALPNITITLAGHAFTMPPQTYVAKMEVTAADGKTSLAAAARVQSLLGALGGAGKSTDPFSSFRRRVSTIAHAIMLGGTAAAPLAEFACVPLFMEMDMSLGELSGTPIILGIPFLRAHVASFNRDERTVGLAPVPVGSTYCSSCAATSLTEGFAAANTRRAEGAESADTSASSRSSERRATSLLTWPRLGRKLGAQGRGREASVRESAAMQPPQLDAELLTDATHGGASPRQHPHRAPKLRVIGLRLPSWLTSAHLR